MSHRLHFGLCHTRVARTVLAAFVAVVTCCAPESASAQQVPRTSVTIQSHSIPLTETIPTAQTAHPEAGMQQPAAPVLKITLSDALERAKKISPIFRRTIVNEKIAAETTVQTRGINLPTVTGNSQYLYTQGNGTPSARFIANNGVHEYIAQADVHQVLSLANVALYRKSVMAAAIARDQTEITRRGLMVTVVRAYATVVAAKEKYESLQKAADTARDFLKTTQQLEKGGEVARADVIKAQIQSDDSEIAARDGLLALENARVALALMILPNVDRNFVLIDNPAAALILPGFEDAEADARHHNPSIDAAFRGVKAASDAVNAARADYLPTMTLDYFYGIDANHFATKTPSAPRLDPELHGLPIQNLGYSAMATLTVPIWNWGATHSRVKTAIELRQQAKRDLTFAQRQLIANLETFYREAQTAHAELAIRRSSAADAETSQRLTLMQYKAGDATALEVVSAQNTLTAERNALADAEIRYATALANLATLTGTL